MKENGAKIVVGFVIVSLIICFTVIVNTIFSSSENIDMFIVWLIFAAEGIKGLFSGGWNSAITIVGSICLLIFAVWGILRLLGAGGLTLDSNGEPEFEPKNPVWKEGAENYFQKMGKPLLKWGIMFWCLAFFMDFLAVGIPNAKQAAVIYVVPKIMNNADMKEIPPNLAKLVNEGLKDMIEGLKDETGQVVQDVKEEVKKAVDEKVHETADNIKNTVKNN